MSEDNGWRTIAMREQAKVKAMEAVVEAAKKFRSLRGQARIDAAKDIDDAVDALKEVK